MLSAQSPVPETQSPSEVRAYSYTGDVVNANCYQAAMIVNRNSRRVSPAVAAANAFTRENKPVPSASPKKKKEGTEPESRAFHSVPGRLWLARPLSRD